MEPDKYDLELKDFAPVLAMSEKSIAFTSNIYVNNIKVAFASNRGQGLEIYVRWYDENAQEEFNEYLQSLDAQVDQSLFFVTLVKYLIQLEELRNQCQIKTFVRWPEVDYEEGMWSVYPHPYNDNMKEIFATKQPSRILNDEIKKPFRIQDLDFSSNGGGNNPKK